MRGSIASAARGRSEGYGPPGTEHALKIRTKSPENLRIVLAVGMAKSNWKNGARDMDMMRIQIIGKFWLS